MERKLRKLRAQKTYQPSCSPTTAPPTKTTRTKWSLPRKGNRAIPIKFKRFVSWGWPTETDNKQLQFLATPKVASVQPPSQLTMEINSKWRLVLQHQSPCHIRNNNNSNKTRFLIHHRVCTRGWHWRRTLPILSPNNSQFKAIINASAYQRLNHSNRIISPHSPCKTHRASQGRSAKTPVIAWREKAFCTSDVRRVSELPLDPSNITE